MDDISNSDDQLNHPPNPTGIISPAPFKTKRPNRPNKIARFKFFFQTENNPLITKLITSLNFIHHWHKIKPLHNYSNVNTNLDEYPIDNTPVNTDNDSPVKIFSNQYTLFLHHLLKLSWSAINFSTEHFNA